MEYAKNSCGRRGCDVRVVLPNDGVFKHVYSRVLSVRNDTKKVLSLTQSSMDSIKKAS